LYPRDSAKHRFHKEKVGYTVDVPWRGSGYLWGKRPECKYSFWRWQHGFISVATLTAENHSIGPWIARGGFDATSFRIFNPAQRKKARSPAKAQKGAHPSVSLTNSSHWF